MKCVKGNKSIEMSKIELDSLVAIFKDVEVDLGTGDGRFVYSKALKNHETLYIGVDPSQKQLEKYSKKAVRKKLQNILFVIGSVELIPKELINTTNKLYINLPWGSLLGNIINTDPNSLNNISNLLVNEGRLTILIGYAKEAEPNEFQRLDLPEINQAYIDEILKPAFRNVSLELADINEVSKEELKEIESTWSKKLSFGQDRPLYRLEFIKS